MFVPSTSNSVSLFLYAHLYLTNLFFVVVLLMCAEMDLFAVVKLEKPKQVTIGVRPLREGEQPILEATEGRLTVLPEIVPENTPPLQVTPVQSVAPEEVVQEEEVARAQSSDSVEILKPEEVLKEEVAQNMKRKGEAGTSGTRKRRRHIIRDAESSAEEKTSAPSADKNDVEVSPSL